ncbi:MAG: TerB family tellurite resistance protein [Paracoccus sp. (in: a-proteobacteria)]|uniref:tellurite resistance TerB family protein n=1 Tax=Paracoccus sp. TaxID=267 RepID=UPI0026E0DBB8|nr:TerB family tellurite resistance protein [Paracoccus sp. (in: a-proteobacteria)]MDO5622215.1 TerB family tellurite resistance protein [Paracoccus sp. (in: a-proteobacteria)]
MFRNLLSRLFAPDAQSAPLRGEDAELAIAALLVRVARADDNYRDVERRHIDAVLARRRGLSTTEAAERRETAEMVEAEAPDTVRFTRSIKDRIALEDRQGVIAAMWEIAYADGRRAPDEESMIRLVAGLLGVSDRDSALARQQVIDSLGLTER